MNDFRPLLLCVAALLAVGCKAKAAALDLACVKHQDCALVTMGPDCCDICEPRVGNANAVGAFLATCAKTPGKNCPELKCAPPTFTAMCQDDGRCVARPGVHGL
jgi:hypothetical protein